MSLTSLPAEVLQEICRCIQRIDDGEENGVRELKSLVRCCRYLKTFASPYLYQNIRLEPKRVYSLLRTLLGNPNLALGIKKMRLIPQLSSDRNRLDLGKAYTMLQRADLPKACTRYLHPDDPKNINLLLTELLLLQTSRLEHLILDLSIIDLKATLFDGKRWKQGTRFFPAQTLPNLNSLSVYFSETLRWGEKRDVIAQTQNLINFSAPSSLWVEVDEPFNYKYNQLRLSSVEDLHITTGGMSKETFTNLLRTCPNAQFLEYRNCIGPMEVFGMQTPDIKLRDVFEILRSHRPTLQALKVSFYDDIDGDGHHENVLPDLRSFTQLRDLGVDAEALKWVRDHEHPDDLLDLSDDWHENEPETYEENPEKWCSLPPSLFMSLLPSSLEKLRIDRADDTFYQELRSLVTRRAQFPKLKTVILDHFEEQIGEEFMKLQNDLMTVGIELSCDQSYPEEMAERDFGEDGSSESLELNGEKDDSEFSKSDGDEDDSEGS